MSRGNSGDQLVLEVKDTGVGIPTGVDIFELFHRRQDWDWRS